MSTESKTEPQSASLKRLVRPVCKGWFEEYRCGCVSGIVKTKRELCGYCPKHGEDRRRVHPILPSA